MPTNSDLSPQERWALIQRLNALPDTFFKMLVFALNPPRGILPSDLAAQGNRAFTLLEWVEGVTGPGLGLLCDLLEQIGGKPLIEKKTNLTTADWSMLFQGFSPYVFAELQSAFLKAFFDTNQKHFLEMRPDHPPLQRPEQIQSLLALYDDPCLTVRFVERVCGALESAGAPHNCDLAALKQWRDGIAEKFKVPPPPPPPDKNPIRYAYLLITLEPLNDSQVIAYPELRLTGQEKPIPLGVSPVKAAADHLADTIAQWIDLAEDAMGSEDSLDSEVILELFLPSRYLLSEHNLATQWRVSDSLEPEPIALAYYRRLVVRSADRVLIRKETLRRQIQQRLCQNWQRLQTCVQNNSVCGDFHRQLKPPSEPGELQVLLNDKPGLKFLAPWPTEADQQIRLINEMIRSAVPIALWSLEGGDTAALEAQIDALLGGCPPTSFARLAHQWRSQRIASSAARPIRLLCDCPDRLPRLPGLGDEDALVTPA